MTQYPKAAAAPDSNANRRATGTPPRLSSLSRAPNRGRITSIPHPPRQSPRVGKGFWITGGLAVYCLTAYGAYLYINLSSEPQAVDGKSSEVPEDVSDRYDKTARSFDSEVGYTEWVMGIGKRRKRLAEMAKGNVLEVGVGTGRNSEYYDLKRCKTITMIDQSAEMMEIARKKFQGTRRSRLHRAIQLTRTRGPPGIQGLPIHHPVRPRCHPDSPPRLRHHSPDHGPFNAENGQILLLEHGRSRFAWLNSLLDKHAAAHADKHGCWWNKDIGKIVEDSGLEVVAMRRYHLGTTWWVELRPKKG